MFTVVACSSSSGDDRDRGTPVPFNLNGTDLPARVPTRAAARHPNPEEQAILVRELRAIGMPHSGLDANKITGWAINTCDEIGRSTTMQPLVKYVMAEFSYGGDHVTPKQARTILNVIRTMAWCA
jgi:hypothetical protein